jgi:uncharacterized DUF497 family protein
LTIARPAATDAGVRAIRLEWDEENEGHIAAHGVRIEEVEEVVYRDAAPTLCLRGRHAGRERRCYCLGRTGAGRYLFCVVAIRGPGAWRCITSRDMTRAERRRY